MFSLEADQYEVIIYLPSTFKAVIERQKVVEEN